LLAPHTSPAPLASPASLASLASLASPPLAMSTIFTECTLMLVGRITDELFGIQEEGVAGRVVLCDTSGVNAFRLEAGRILAAAIDLHVSSRSRAQAIHSISVLLDDARHWLCAYGPEERRFLECAHHCVRVAVDMLLRVHPLNDGLDPRALHEVAARRIHRGAVRAVVQGPIGSDAWGGWMPPDFRDMMAADIATAIQARRRAQYPQPDPHPALSVLADPEAAMHAAVRAHTRERERRAPSARRGARVPAGAATHPMRLRSTRGPAAPKA
jgi:hypothetical protein